MAVISKQKVSFAGKPFLRVIKVDAKGEFSMDLPPALIERLQLQRSYVTAPSKEQVLKAYKDKCQEYHTAQTSTRKVILYSSEFSGYIVDQKTEQVLLNKHSHYGKGLSLDVGVGVYTETKVVNATGTASYDYTWVKSSIPYSVALRRVPTRMDPENFRSDDPHLLEWTQQREDFFASLARLLEALILKLHDMGEKREILAMVSNSRDGIKLLTKE